MYPKVQHTIIFILITASCLQASYIVSQTDSIEQALLDYPKPDTLRIGKLLELSKILEKSNFNLSLQFAKEADSLSTAVDYLNGSLKSQLQLSSVLLKGSEFQDALDHGINALKIAINLETSFRN